MNPSGIPSFPFVKWRLAVSFLCLAATCYEHDRSLGVRGVLEKDGLQPGTPMEFVPADAVDLRTRLYLVSAENKPLGHDAGFLGAA